MKVVKIKNKKSEYNILDGLKKFWDFVWNGNSIWSWIVSLILAFIFIKFIFFPFLSLIFGSSMPLVVVESSSMHHDGFFISNWLQSKNSFENWWNQNKNWYLSNTNINFSEAEKFSLRNGFEKGDIIIITRGKHEVGDVIVFEANQRYPIIHRIINISNDSSGRTIYETKGDNNNAQLPIEKQISEEQIIGEAKFVIPKLGWIKLFFVEILS